MDLQSKEWRDLEEIHLGELTQWGIHFSALIEGSAVVLQKAFLGEIELSRDEQREMFAALVDAAKKHSELVRRSLKERQDFVDAQRNRD